MGLTVIFTPLSRVTSSVFYPCHYADELKKAWKNFFHAFKKDLSGPALVRHSDSDGGGLSGQEILHQGRAPLQAKVLVLLLREYQYSLLYR